MNHKSRHARTRALLGLAPLLAALAGCTWGPDRREKLDLGVDAQAAALANSAAYRGTIGSLGYYDGLAPMRVRGYGLVVGLGKNGSSDCPRRVYDKLVQSIYKQHHVSSSVVGAKTISPEALIADVDTAVVVVVGDIPAAAVAGTSFDVSVTALPGTQTKSLRGGRLFAVELEVFHTLPSGVSVVGQALARASGPVLMNPFSEGDAATKSNPLEGTVVGGGLVLKDRRLRFVLSEPSYHNARRIQERINGQFTGPKRMADAISPSLVRLKVPRDFHREPGHYLELVRSLYLTRDPQFEATRARALAEEIVRPTAPHARIALCLEGLGRAALPVLDDLYVHPKDYVSFHAAVAGLRLGDHVACDRMSLHAKDPSSNFRFQAIRALADAVDMNAAAMTLRGLLADDDPRVQVAAYEALVDRGDQAVPTKSIAGDNFNMDAITSSSARLVYVRRAGARRIALFGEDLECTPPLLYRSPDGSVTISAETDAEKLTIMRTVVASGTTSHPIEAPLELASLIELMGNDAGVGADGEAVGLGLDYGAVVRALYSLCEDGAINARFMLEQPNAAELFGPARPTGRPESEL
jgi:hypothetical protein